MKLKSLNMNLRTLKSCVNNEKGRLFKGKITESSITFSENKANLKNVENSVSSFQTRKYEILPAWRSKKQTQFKPNTNPIPKRPKMNANHYFTSKYEDKSRERVKKTNPIQSQNKPNTSLSSVYASCFPAGDLSSNVAVGEPIIESLFLTAGSVLLLRLTYSMTSMAYLISQLRHFKNNCFMNGERKMGNNTKKLFNFRAFVSVLAGVSFILMAVTGLVLFFTPSCRIARETSWIFWGHDKEQWAAIHVWFSIAFVIASFFHIYLNWTALTGYFKTKLRNGFAFRAEWISVLVICGIFYVATIYEVAPFSSLIAWKETFKHGGTGPAEQGRRFGQAGMRALERQFTPAAEARVSDTCGNEEHAKQQTGHRTGRGTGQKTLKEFCNDEGLDLPKAIERLSKPDFTAKQTMTMREIANEFSMHPSELRGILLDNRLVRPNVLKLY